MLIGGADRPGATPPPISLGIEAREERRSFEQPAKPQRDPLFQLGGEGGEHLLQPKEVSFLAANTSIAPQPAPGF